MLQSELTSPEDDFLDVGHAAPVPVRSAVQTQCPLTWHELQDRVTSAIKVFHHPLGCHVVDLTRSLQPSAKLLDCAQHVRSSSENPLCLAHNGAKHSVSCLIQFSLLPPSVALVGFLVSWAFWRASRPSSRPFPRCNLKVLSPGTHLGLCSTAFPGT